MKVKNKVWRFITVLIVIFLILNPEMVEFSIFINAVGIDIFIMLLQIQFIVISGAFFDKKIRPLWYYCKNQFTNIYYSCSLKRIKNEPRILLLIIPSQASLMYVLVFSAMLGI